MEQVLLLLRLLHRDWDLCKMDSIIYYKAQLGCTLFIQSVSLSLLRLVSKKALSVIYLVAYVCPTFQLEYLERDTTVFAFPDLRSGHMRRHR